MPRIEITATTLGPYGVGQMEGKAVMIPHTAPGDVVEAEVTSRRADYARARVKEIVRGGPARRVAPCEYLPRCGGCDWQHLEYAAQLQLKGELLAREFRRIGVEVEPAGLVEASPNEFGCRARVRLKVGAGGVVGYHELESNRLVAIERCLVTSCELEPAKEFLRETRLRAAEVEIVGRDSAQVLICHCSALDDAQIKRAQRQLDQDGRVAGVILKTARQRIALGDVSIAYEPESGCEIVADADCFSQVNLAQNQKLVASVIELAEIERGMGLLDLFCGAGNFSLPAAERGAAVTGVDADELAIAAARRNAARMKLGNAQFIATPAAAIAQFLHRAKYRPASVILDPPRSGAAAMIEAVVRLGASKIVYVSCEPSTLMRDLGVLTAHRYRVAQVRAFDFFPQTHHVETVASLLLT